MMDDKTLILEALKAVGAREAAELRSGANDMDGTEIIEMERAAPAWSKEQDYTSYPKGSPVTDEEQVWTLITPHNAANYEGRPSTLRALWNLCHTKNPARAKPWVDPNGQSGMYMRDECYKKSDGTVYRCKQDNCVWDADAMPSYWEKVEV